MGRSDKELLGLPVFRSVLDLPLAVDLAVIAVPALQVPSVLKECGQKGVRYATITSSGFGEYSEERSALDGQLLEIARKYGMRFSGPIAREFGTMPPAFARASANRPERMRCSTGSGSSCKAARCRRPSRDF